jgi:LEA14-like dessication related protein
MNRWILFLGLIAILVSCKKPQDFQFLGVRNFRLENPSLNGATVSADLAYYNPNKYGVKVKHVDAQIFANGNLVGTYTLDTLMQIPAKENFIFPARLEIKNMRPIFGSLASILANKEIVLRIAGKTKVGKGGFFVNIPFDFTTSQKLDINF